MNCHLARLVGLSHTELLVLEFRSSNPEGFLFFLPFSKFLSLVSFFRVRLSVRLRFRIRIRVKVRF